MVFRSRNVSSSWCINRAQIKVSTLIPRPVFGAKFMPCAVLLDNNFGTVLASELVLSCESCFVSLDPKLSSRVSGRKLSGSMTNF